MGVEQTEDKVRTRSGRGLTGTTWGLEQQGRSRTPITSLHCQLLSGGEGTTPFLQVTVNLRELTSAQALK